MVSPFQLSGLRNWSGPGSAGGLRLDQRYVASAALRGIGSREPRAGAALPEKNDGAEPGASHTPHRTVPARRGSEAEAIPAAPFSAALHAGGYRAAGGLGRGARDAERAGDAQASGAGVLRFWRPAVPAVGGAFGGAVVPAAAESRLPPAPGGLPADTPDGGIDWGTAEAGAEWASRIPAGGHGASGGSGRDQGRVSHQRRRRGHAVGGGGGHGADQRGVSAAGAESHAGAVSVPHSRVSFRQRQRVHQPYGGQTAEQTAHRTDQIAAAALQRQRPGRGEERSRRAETHGVHAHRGAARGGDRRLLRRVLQSVSELSSAVRGTGVGGRRQGQSEASVPVVCDTLGDSAAVAGPAGPAAQTQPAPRPPPGAARGPAVPW